MQHTPCAHYSSREARHLATDGVTYATLLRDAGHGDLIRMNETNADDTMRLKVAFAYRVAHMIAEADQEITDVEFDALAQFFPYELLGSFGFVENGGFTDVYHEAVTASLDVLDSRLSLHEKLGLVTLFVRMCYADGELHAREADLIKDAAELLGVTNTEFNTHLQALFE